MSGPTISYITPTFAPDIERFALLRHSLRLFSPDILHIAYVDTEDQGVFRARFGGEPGLRIMTTADALPPTLDAQRRFWRGWRGYVADRIAWRTGLEPRTYSGWKMQQLVKLYAAAKAETEAVVFLDSDIVLCAPVPASTYHSGGDLKLLETRATTFEDFAFDLSCRKIFRDPLNEPAEAFSYIHQAPRFLRRTAAVLLERLEKIHGSWTARFYREPFPSEYNLLGYAARFFENYRSYRLDEASPAEWLYSVKSPDRLAEALAACRREQGRRQFFLVQSNMQLTDRDYIPTLQSLIDTLAARSGA